MRPLGDGRSQWTTLIWSAPRYYPVDDRHLLHRTETAERHRVLAGR